MEADMEKCGGQPLAAGSRPAVVMWDLNARDAPTVRHFYSELFHWEVSEPSSDRVRLAMVTCGEGGIHGVIGQAPREDEEDFGERHSGLIVYIKVMTSRAIWRRPKRSAASESGGPRRSHPG